MYCRHCGKPELECNCSDRSRSREKREQQGREGQNAIENAQKTELEEFQGCGLEVPDLQDKENLKKFQEWNGELRFVQNFKLKRITKNSLQEPIEDVHQMITE